MLDKSWKTLLRWGCGLALLAGAGPLLAQTIEPGRGRDALVDYATLTRFGPWDDRNYELTRADLAYLAPDEQNLHDPIPAFFRVELRKRMSQQRDGGPRLYPRSAFNFFLQRYGGYLYRGKLYRELEPGPDGTLSLVLKDGLALEEFSAGEQPDALSGEVRVTTPNGGAETAIKIHPADPNRVVAGSNGPGGGQKMHYSINGGSTWSAAAALPLGGTCCDPAVDWSSNGQYAYAASLGDCFVVGSSCQVWVYRSADGGATWDNFSTLTAGDPRRELTTAGASDKEYLHVDKFATSPFKDNLYMTWHDGNILKFSRSTDFGNTWSAILTLSGTGQSGIGSDLTTDKNGNIYYFWPATSAKTILVRKSTNGGASFNAAVTVANTQDGYDFAIPAMETRRAFIYVSADADVTSGPFANRIYAAWTDTTAPEAASASANHGRIQVGRSSDGGATWQVTTPHETADASSVDRFHPWLSVGPDGKVYVIFYDTRRVTNRTGVDLFYSISADGGVTFGAPQRLTSVISPNITDGFEWGDYNGLDVVMNQLIAIYTDNRKEGAETGDSVDAYAIGALVGGAPTPDFSVSCSPASVSVAQGGSAGTSCTVTSTGGFNSAVTLGCGTLPAGVSCGFAPVSVTPPANGSISSTLTFTASGTATTGTSSVAVNGVSGATTRSTSVSLSVTAVATPDFTIACTPSSVTAAAGGSVNSTCTVTSTGGFASAVSLSCAGQPAGVSCSYAPASVTPPANGSVNSTLTIAVAAGTPAGTSTFQARGTNGTTLRNANITLTISGGGGGAQTALYDATLRAPKCATVGSSCDSGASLLLGRATKGPEPNQPNTINASCADGTTGTFHVDESNDRLKVSTVDGTSFAAGKQVRIDATVWAYSSFTSDKLDLYYAANAAAPTWTFVGTLTPTAAGAQTLSATYTLPAGTLQAVRAQFRYTGTAGTCSTGGYNDRDDLIFAVQ